MSKSTNRYGKVLLHAQATIDANPKPTQKLLEQWADLEAAARSTFKKSYDKLTDTQRTDLHLAMRLEQKKKKEKPCTSDLT
jgi:hypothetical protein